MWEDNNEDFTADTFDEFDRNPKRQEFQSNTSDINGGRSFFDQQYYEFFHYTRSENSKQFAFQHSYDNRDRSGQLAFLNSRNKALHQKDFKKTNQFKINSFQKLPYKARNNYKAKRSLNPQALKRGFKKLITLQGTPNGNCDKISIDQSENWITSSNTPVVSEDNVPKKETQKLKILRHTPVPASAKISPKKIIEKIAKFNKASLKNIINNPSKYDDVLQKFGREQALEDQKNEPQTPKSITRSDDDDRGGFEIIPDDTVEVSADFFDFLQMESVQEPENKERVMSFVEEKQEVNFEIEMRQMPSKPDLMTRLMTAETIKTTHAKKQEKTKNIERTLKSRCVKARGISKTRNDGSPPKVVDSEKRFESNLEKDLEVDPTGNESPKGLNGALDMKNEKHVDENDALPSPRLKSIEFLSPYSPSEPLNEDTAMDFDEPCKKSLKSPPIDLSNGKDGASQRSSRVDVFLKNTGKTKKPVTRTPGGSRTLSRNFMSDEKPKNGSTKRSKIPSSHSMSSTCSRSGSSSSSSSTSSSSSSSSYSTSSTTSCSSSHLSRPLHTKREIPEPTRKRLLMERRNRLHGQKLHIQNIVDSFEARILPNLPQHLVVRYREKYSKSLDTKLLFICRICTNSQQKELLQSELKSPDKKKAIIILMREVTNVIKKQPQVDKTLAKDTPCREDTETNNLIEGKSERKEDSNAESVDVAKNDEKPLHQSVDEAVGQLLHRGEKKEDISADETNLNCKAVYKDNVEEKEKLVEQPNDKRTNKEMTAHRQWQLNSYEKNVEDFVVKMDLANEQTTVVPFMLPPTYISSQQSPHSGYTNFESFANMGNTPSNVLPMTLNVMQHQNNIPGPWMSNVHDIDCRISDLVKRKQFINEMIAKLQKDTMELDIQIVGLQKEKFMLLNAAITANANSSALNTPKTSKGDTIKQRNSPRSKRCVKRNFSNRLSFNTTPTLGTIRHTKPGKNGVSRIISMEETPSQSDKENTEMTNGLSLDHQTEEAIHQDLFDYSNMPTGELTDVDSPVNQITIYQDRILAATEDGHICRFNMSTLEMAEQCRKHDTTITQLKFCEKNLMLYTTGLDGYLKATPLNDFQSETQKLHLNDQIQSLDIQWDTAFMGTRSGNIYTCNILAEPLTATVLHAGDSAIMAVKATKEGPRKVLIISSKENSILFRDAMNGLLLRIINVKDNLCIYGFLFDDSHLYCGTQRQQVLKFDFTNGTHISTFYCGNGVVAMKMYKLKYVIVACYDGYIYILNKHTGDKIEMLPASGRLPLTLEIFGNKLITSSKDKKIKIIDIPSLIVNG